MNTLMKLIKIPKNNLNSIKLVVSNFSTDKTDASVIEGYSETVNPESSPIKKLNATILKTLGKKSIELPRLDPEFSQTTQTIASLDVSNEALTWIHVKKDGCIIDWNFVEFNKDLIYNPDFNIAYEYLHGLYEDKLPKDCNAYLFEDKRYKARESKMLQYIIKLQKNEVILESLIKSKIIGQKDKKIFKMNSGKVAKKFNILVGNERVRASDLIRFMIKPRDNFHLDLENFVLNGSDQYVDFFLNSNTKKEPLAINYLQASCFVNLLQDYDLSSSQ